eukprot:6482481-Amphidinium_carterae.1
MKDLTDISHQATVSTDVQAQLLLRSQVIAAAGNRMDMDSIEQGLSVAIRCVSSAARWIGVAALCSLISYSAAARPGGRSGGWNGKPGKGGRYAPWSKGGRMPWRATAYVAEEMGGQAPVEEPNDWD